MSARREQRAAVLAEAGTVHTGAVTHVVRLANANGQYEVRLGSNLSRLAPTGDVITLGEQVSFYQCKQEVQKHYNLAATDGDSTDDDQHRQRREVDEELNKYYNRVITYYESYTRGLGDLPSRVYSDLVDSINDFFNRFYTLYHGASF